MQDGDTDGHTDRPTDGRVAADDVTVIRIAGRSSTVQVDGLPGATFDVQGGTFVVADDGSIDVTPGSGKVHVVCAERSHVVISTASGAVRVHGHVADVRVMTSSGRVEIERSIDADVRTRSSSVHIGSCVNTCRVVSTSGTVRVADAREVGISTSSSSVEVGRTAVADVRTVSGTIRIGAAPSATVQATSMSGKVRVTLPAGIAATMRLSSRSGSIERGVPEGEGAVVEVSTSSGSIKVLPA